jgi:ABC-2 type transport system ATP-binding protein
MVITARGLTKRYRETLAVDDLTFEVRPGEVTGFLGPNGSGKSTTMRLILGLDYPDAGRAAVNGRRYAELSWPLREVGSLLEAKAFHPGRSGFHHLLALAQTHDIPRSRVEEVLDLVGLTAVAHKRAGTFSLGMGQRLGIAAALLGDPEVLLFDEPINGLDPDGIIWMRNLLTGLAADGRTVFVSSHLISEIALSAGRLVVIGKGRLIAETSVAEMIAASPGRFVRVRSPQDAELLSVLYEAGATVRRERDGTLAVEGLDADAIAELAARRHVVLHELSPQTASLEEAFMELTHGVLEYQGAGQREQRGAGPGDSSRAGQDRSEVTTP